MSHEIRTPMNAILGYAQIMQRSGDLPANHLNAVDTIQRSGNHLLELINEVLDLSKIEAGRMELTAGPENTYHFAVIDTGIGIATEEQQTLFEPFQQSRINTPQEGTGLGLALARRHVELMGGELTLESTPGEGSRFAFQLNLPPAQAKLVSSATMAAGTIKHLAPGPATHPGRRRCAGEPRCAAPDADRHRCTGDLGRRRHPSTGHAHHRIL
jgi:signal transduction histidine kinase